MGLSLLFKGFNYVANYNGDFERGDTYGELLATGINSVGLTYESGIDPATSSIFQNYVSQDNQITDRGYSETQAGVTAQIQQSVASGQTVFVRPFIDFLTPAVTGVALGKYQDGEWRQYYQPTNVAAFFANYTSFIVKQAKAAQLAGATSFDIGTELDALITTKTLGYWTTLINDVRAVFSGQLTYSSSWIDGGTGGSIGTIPAAFWKQLDYVGVDAYVIAPDPNDLVGAWTKPPTDPILSQAFQGKSAIDYYESVSDAVGKPLIITEVGYTDASDAATNPLDQNGQKDPSVQAALYNAFFSAWEQAGVTSLTGVYWTYWAPASDDGQGIPTDFPPRNNPDTISAVQAGFSAPDPYVVTLTARPQTISGVIADTTGPREVVITPYTALDRSGASVANGKILLTGANTYSGGTLIMAGTIGLGNTQALGTGGLDILAGELDLNRYSLSIPTLRGGGRIVATAGTGPASTATTIAVASGTFAGSLRDQAATSTLELIKTGSGTLSLSGTSAYSTTLIDDGTLEIAAVAAAGDSAITFGSQTGTLMIDNAALAKSLFVRGKGYVFGSLLTHIDVGDSIILGGLSGVPTVAMTTAPGIVDLTLSGVTGIAGGTITLQVGATEYYATASPLSVAEVNGNLVLTVTDHPLTNGLTVSTFVAAKTTLDKIAGGFEIADKASNVIARLGLLASDSSHLTSITSTDIPVTVAAASLAYVSALDKVDGGYGISDTGGAIQSALDRLTADNAHITSINVKSGSVTTSVATFLKDQIVLDRLANGFSISDKAANIDAALASLTTDADHITRITAIDKPITVNVASFLSNAAAVDKVIGGVVLVDDPSAVAANIDALSNDLAHIRSISFGTIASPVVALTATQAASNAGLLAKISGAYILEASQDNATSTLAGHGNGLTFHVAQNTNTTVTGAGTSETFAFDAGPWQSTITDFSKHLVGAAHDTIALSTGDFTDFAAVLHDAVSSSSGTIVTSPTTGSQLTLPNVSASALLAAKTDFKFS